MSKLFPKATTILARSSLSLFKSVKDFALRPDHVLVYALSSNIDKSHLPNLIAHFGKASMSVGCLTHPLPTPSHPFSCSILSLKSDLCSVLRSNIPGREKVSVGRWYRPASNAHPSHAEGIEDLPEMKARPSAFLMLSDDAPEGCFAHLDQLFPEVPKLGIIATATPFVTGRPHTLLKDAEAYSSGAVGIMVSSTIRQPVQRVGYAGLVDLSEAYVITSAAANLIHTIDGKNPTRELLDKIHNHGVVVDESTIIGKDVDLYLSVEEETQPDSWGRIYRIIAGGPSRGTIALDAENGPPQGSRVKFMYRPHSTPIDLPPSLNAASTVEFINSSPEDASDGLGSWEEDVIVKKDRFIAASEGGCIVGRPLRDSWRSSVTGGWATFGWGLP